MCARVRWPALTPTSVDRAGSTPCGRANARTSPGSGGRHQQAGGPPPWVHSAPRPGPTTAAGQRRDLGRARRGAVGPPVEDEVRRVRALPSALPPGCRSARPRRRRPLALGRAGRRSNGTCSTRGEALVRGRRLELAERTHLRGRREQARLASRERPQLVGRGQRADAIEDPLDQVHLRLRERRVEPHAAWCDVVAGRRLDRVAPRRPRQVRVVEDDAAGARREQLVQRLAEVRSDPPRSSRFSRT